MLLTRLVYSFVLASKIADAFRHEHLDAIIHTGFNSAGHNSMCFHVESDDRGVRCLVKLDLIFVRDHSAPGSESPEVHCGCALQRVLGIIEVPALPNRLKHLCIVSNSAQLREKVEVISDVLLKDLGLEHGPLAFALQFSKRKVVSVRRNDYVADLLRFGFHSGSDPEHHH